MSLTVLADFPPLTPPLVINEQNLRKVISGCMRISKLYYFNRPTLIFIFENYLSRTLGGKIILAAMEVKT